MVIFYKKSMKGQAYINNQDISKWGASFAKGAYEALLKPAPTKENVRNESRIEDGVREDTSNIRLSERTISLPFWIVGTSEDDYLAKYEDFLDEIASGVIVLKVPALKKVYKLIYSDCSSYGHYNRIKGKIILKLKEPNPRDREFL